MARRGPNRVPQEIRKLLHRLPPRRKLAPIQIDLGAGNDGGFAALVPPHRSVDGGDRGRLVLVLEQREIDLFLLAEVRVQQRVNGVQDRLQRRRVVDVDSLELPDPLTQELVVEGHAGGREGMAELVCDLRIQPGFLRLGVQPQIAAKEVEDLGDDGATLGEPKRRNLTSRLCDLVDARPEAVVSGSKRLCQLLCHRHNFRLSRPRRHPRLHGLVYGFSDVRT